MDWNAIQGRWHTMVGSARERWDKLSHDEIRAIGGKRDALIQKLKDKYGMSHEQAEKEVNDFQKSQAQGTASERTRTLGDGH